MTNPWSPTRADLGTIHDKDDAQQDWSWLLALTLTWADQSEGKHVSRKADIVHAVLRIGQDHRASTCNPSPFPQTKKSETSCELLHAPRCAAPARQPNYPPSGPGPGPSTRRPARPTSPRSPSISDRKESVKRTPERRRGPFHSFPPRRAPPRLRVPGAAGGGHAEGAREPGPPRRPAP
jgi:hypothetical protein